MVPGLLPLAMLSRGPTVRQMHNGGSICATYQSSPFVIRFTLLKWAALPVLEVN